MLSSILEPLHATLAKEGLITLKVRVRPGAKENRVRGTMIDGTYKIDIAAAPEHGKANDALREFLAEEFDVPVSYVGLLTGTTSRSKYVRISKVTKIA